MTITEISDKELKEFYQKDKVCIELAKMSALIIQRIHPDDHHVLNHIQEQLQDETIGNIFGNIINELSSKDGKIKMLRMALVKSLLEKITLLRLDSHIEAGENALRKVIKN